jgi:hypothetical protein
MGAPLTGPNKFMYRGITINKVLFKDADLGVELARGNLAKVELYKWMSLSNVSHYSLVKTRKKCVRNPSSGKLKQ